VGGSEPTTDRFAICESNCPVHVISRKKLPEAVAMYGSLSGPLDAWYRIARGSAWQSIGQVRRSFPSADAVGAYVVFNMKGNTFRLIAEINYRTERLYIRYVLAHAEYDKDDESHEHPPRQPSLRSTPPPIPSAHIRSPGQNDAYIHALHQLEQSHESWTAEQTAEQTADPA
jgi:mRNA interferase HigB